MTTDTIQDRVREAYAAAARTAAAGRPASCGGTTPDAGPDAGQAGCCGEDCCAGTTSDAGQAGCCGGDCCGGEPGTGGAGGAGLPVAERGELPLAAQHASLGCGNPLAVAELREGETVLDLGSGGGAEVLLSARRVGPTGRVYGLDMTDEMLELARRNAAEAGATNVDFRKGHIEEIPLPEASVDVVISNCVINLSADKPAVFAGIHRVLRPGGRVGVTDIVAEDTLTPDDRAARGDWVGCVAGALSRSEYIDGLTAAGFIEVDVTFTHAVAEGMHSAIIKATRAGHE